MGQSRRKYLLNSPQIMSDVSRIEASWIGGFTTAAIFLAASGLLSFTIQQLASNSPNWLLIRYPFTVLSGQFSNNIFSARYFNIFRTYANFILSDGYFSC